MQIVNGYLCMNCCDVDKARLGEDPHQSANQVQKQIEKKLEHSLTSSFGPAVTFGGSLLTPQASSGADAVIQPQASDNTDAVFANINVVV